MRVELNGRIVDASSASVSPFDAGYLYGDALFETVRGYDGFLFDLDAHLARLEQGAGLLQIPVQFDREDWRQRLKALLDANSMSNCQAVVRIQISRGGGPHTDQIAGDPEGMEPVCFVSARMLPPEIEQWQMDGIRAMTVQASFVRGNFPQLKSTNYLPAIMALRFGRAAGYPETLQINAQGKILEGSSSNVFIVKGDRVQTPSVRLGILGGIARDRVLNFAEKLDLECDEGAFELRELLVADEVFVTSAVKEVVPVVGVDKATIGDGRPGPWTRRLQESYRAAVHAARG